MADSISTGCRSLDEILGGGIPFGKVTLVYGDASTGKTTLAMKSVVNYLQTRQRGVSPPKRALYVDSDGKFSLARFSQIAGPNTKEELLQRLVVSMPESFTEQMGIIEGLMSFTAGNIRLVVLDTITSLYREEIALTGQTFPINRELNRQLAYLKEAAKAQDLVVLLLSQVYSTFNPEQPPITPVSSRLLRYWSDIILRLDITPQAGVRIAFLEKPTRRSMVGCRFKLVASGLTDMGFLDQPSRDKPI